MKKPHIVIENPCHEDWQKMTPENQGRFCQSCEKVVVDFTHMSDAEILHYFSKPKSEKTCGRFRVEQLSPPMQQPLQLSTMEVKDMQKPSWSLPHTTSQKPSKSLLHFAYLLVVVLGVGLSSCGSRENHDEIQGDTTYMGATVVDTNRIDRSDKDTDLIKGEVNDQSQPESLIKTNPSTQESPKTRPHVIELMGDTVAYFESDTSRKTKPVDQREFMTGPYEVPLKPVNPKYIKGKVKLPPHRMGKPAIIEQVHPQEEPKIMGACIMPYEDKEVER